MVLELFALLWRMSNYFAVCARGVEPVLEHELRSLGISQTKSLFSGVAFEGEIDDLYRTNMALRTATRVLKPVAEFIARDFDALYRGVRKIDMYELFRVDQTFRVDVNLVQSTMTHSQFAAQKIKDAIVDQFRQRSDGKLRPSVDLKNPQIVFNVFVSGPHVTFALDASGESLHRRHYREGAGEAPMKEALAAAIVLLSDWDRESPVYDPMCGSGTLLIEAMMIAQNIAPNLNRTFSFQNWREYDADRFNAIREELRGKQLMPKLRGFGMEVSPRVATTARKNIAAAGLDKFIEIKTGDFRRVRHTQDSGLVIVNPPYGERMDEVENLKHLYRELGDHIKQDCQGCTASIFTGNLELRKFVGLRTKERILLYNGAIEGRLLKYNLY